MYDLLMLLVVILPPLLAHLVSRRYCHDFDDLSHDDQAGRMYRLSWLTSILVTVQNILPLYVFGAYYQKMTLLQICLQPLESVLNFLADNLQSWLFITICVVAVLALLGLYNLLSIMPWFRLDRQAKKNRGAAPAQARFYLRQFFGAMLPMLIWSCGFTPFVVKAESVLFTFVMLASYLLLLFSLSPLLVRIANPTEALNNEEIETMTRDLCNKAGVRFGKLRLLKYGNVRIANAMVSGILPCFRRIYLTDLLVEKFTTDEIQAILAHEIAHLKKRHLFWLLGLAFIGSVANTCISTYLGSIFGFKDLIELLSMMIYLGVIFSYCSRVFERQADKCAVELTGNVEALASALNKLAELNFVTKKWGKWDIFQSHPDMERRIEYIRQQVYKVSPVPRRIPAFPILMFIFVAVSAITAMAEDKKPAPLVSAIVAKDSAKVAALLESGAYIEQKNDYGNTPLMAAANIGDEKLVRLLVDKGANFYVYNNFGQTPLAFAAAASNVAIVRMLLESGSPVDPVNNDGNSPLMLAAIKGDQESVKLLLKYGAVYKKHNEQKQNLLMLAAMSGNAEVVGIFLDKRVSANEQDTNGFTALTHSLQHPEISRILVNNGADVNAMVTKKLGEVEIRIPILAMAALAGNELSVSKLIELGAKTNEKGSYGITPLLAACIADNWNAVQLLLQLGVDANPAFESIPEELEIGGVTPLIFAAMGGKVDVVRLLIQKGVNVNRRSDVGLTALKAAEMGGHTEVAQLLRQQGATISEADCKEAEDARKRAADSKAVSDLKNAKTSIEAYYADHQSYPDTLDKTGFEASDGVVVSYEPSCDSGGCRGYVVTAKTANGANEYKTSHDSLNIVTQ